MSTRYASWALWIAVWLALGCENYGKPGEPVWNKEACAHCHMLVSDPRFAAQLVTHSHQRHYFDDPGCLAEFMREHAQEVEHAWVRDESGWHAARYARFRKGESSPMGYGFLATGSGELEFSAVEQAAMGRHTGGRP